MTLTQFPPTTHQSTRRHVSWTPETSPSLSEGSEDSDTSLSSPSESDTPPSAPEIMMSEPTSTTSSNPSRLSSGAASSSGPSIHPYRPQPTRTPSISPPKIHLPKSQPLSRALFARMAMAEIPHAGMSNGGAVSKKAGGGGKQKMIVATKPMRTTFELGLTSSELARRQ